MITPLVISKYLKFMENINQASPLTLKAYKNDLNELFDFKNYVTDEKSTRLPVKNDDELKQYLFDRVNIWHKLKISSRNRKIGSLKSFLNWMYENKLINSPISDLIPSPKVPKKIPNFLSFDEIQSCLNVFKNQPQLEFEKILFLILYGSGLRISEACSLKWTNYHSQQRSLRVLGKGNKERLVILPEFVSNELDKIKSKYSQQEYIFGEGPLSSRKGYEWIRQLGIKANLLKPIHPHALRHSYATHLLSSGANLRVIQTLLGHQSLTATEKYTHLNINQLHMTLEKYHPLSKK